MLYRPVFLASFLFGVAQVALSVPLMDALAANPNFSQFSQAVSQDQDLMGLLTDAQKKTLVVPSNDALQNSSFSTLDTAGRQAFVRYHVLNGSYNTQALSVNGGKTTPTYLQSQKEVLLSGDPNVVFASNRGDNGLGAEAQSLVLYSGVGGVSKVTAPDISFDQGLIHGVDKALVTPKNCTTTAQTAGLTSLLKSLDRSNLMTYVDTTDRITCFAPSDAAFKAAGNPDTNLSPDQLKVALQRHTLQGPFIGYSDYFQNGTEYRTVEGGSIFVEKKDGQLLINGVKVMKANVITSNGVAHVLESLLPVRDATTNTSVTKSTPKPTTTTAGASSIFQSGIVKVMAAFLLGVVAWNS